MQVIVYVGIKEIDTFRTAIYLGKAKQFMASKVNQPGQEHIIHSRSGTRAVLSVGS